MNPPNPTEPPEAGLPPRGVLLAIPLLALAGLSLLVVRPFLAPLAWAAILAYASWPLYGRLARLCPRRAGLAALGMTLLVALVLIAPLACFAWLLNGEIARAYQALIAFRAAGAALPPAVASIPWLGAAIGEALARLAADPHLLERLIGEWLQDSRAQLLGMLGAVGRNLAKLLATLIAVFFCYRDGERLVAAGGGLLRRLAGAGVDRYVTAATAMVRAVTFGFLVTALVQGTIAGIGYAVVGAAAPVALGALTALASIVPVIGTGLVWGPVAVSLAVTGHPWAALGLAAWGTVLVHPVDNIVRPLLISSVTRVPFILVLIGVIGGIASFGLVGLFVGPVVLAVATAVVREWLAAGAAPAGAGEPAAPRGGGPPS